MKWALLGGAACLMATAMFAIGDAKAGLYWQQGVRSSSVTVCFVGDAVTSRPERVAQVLQYIREFSSASNVTFSTVAVTCAAPSSRPDGSDEYAGDIRVLLPFTSAPWTGAVPGAGCRMFRDAAGNYNAGNDGWGSWSNAPQDLATNRSCLYNLKLGDDGAGGVPYLNHTLHEFGHALGLLHEHERTDVDPTLGCTEAGFGGNGSSFLTRYDRRSVMHYKFPSCGINGNYDQTGLSDLDRLSVHILYPEATPVAEFSGTTVLPSTRRLTLEAEWGIRGAAVGATMKNFEWQVGGTVRSTNAALDVSLAEGTYSLRFTHDDFLGRGYKYTGIIRILSPMAYANQTAAISVTSLPLE